MKSTKIFALALAALTMTACSDDDNDFSYNTLAGVTVEMEETDVVVNENTGLFNVPIKVTGDRNGYVRVTVECLETGTDPAIANRHYYLTTDVLNIAQDDNSIDVEFSTVDFRGLDPDRTFNVSIAKVEGATIGANKTTTVQINDKGSAPLFNTLAGKWFMSGYTYSFDKQEFSDAYMDLVTANCKEDDGMGGGILEITGIGGSFTMELTYDYDLEEKYGELVFNYGTVAYAAGGALWVNQGGSTNVEPVRGKWNTTYTAVTFGNDESFFGVGAFQDGVFAGFYKLYNGFTLSKMAE